MENHECKFEGRIIDMNGKIEKILAIVEEREKGLQTRNAILIALLSGGFGFLASLVSNICGVFIK